MGFQFVHMEGYARKADRHGRSVRWVLAEAAREPDACPHVSNPAPPEVVYGAAPGDVLRQHDEACDVARVTLASGRTRAVRKDQKTMLTVVASHPATMEQVRSDPKVAADVAEWERRSVAWLRDRYGAGLVSVIRHADESHAHLHAYVLPADLRAMSLHPGASAKRIIMAAGAVDGEDAKSLNKRGDDAYRAAMRGWLDSYWESVGLPSGLTRLGPGRRRLSRGEWQAERAASESVKVALDRAASIRQKGQEYASRTKGRAAEIISAAEVVKDAAVKQAEDAKVLHDAAVERERQANGLLSRARKEAFWIIESARSKAARLSSIGMGIRSLWDGLRRSSIERRARHDAAADVARERDRAEGAARQAAEESRRRREAERRARDSAEAVRATAAERDRARNEIMALRPSPAPGVGMRMGR